MIVERQGRTFTVVDDPVTGSWRFWQDQFAGEWEAETFKVLDKYLDPDRDFIDIGAWVGPLSLWAAPSSRRVVAVEPDPVANGLLVLNAHFNECDNIDIYQFAVVAENTDELVALERGGQWGDSTSSIVTNRGGVPMLCEARTLSNFLFDTNPALIKIDTEGAEALILPANVDLLHDAACPIIVALHWPWLNADLCAQLRSALASFTVDIIDGTNAQFPTVMLT